MSSSPRSNAAALLVAVSVVQCTPEPVVFSTSSQPEEATVRCSGGISCEQLRERVGLHDGAHVCVETAMFQTLCTGDEICDLVETSWTSTAQGMEAARARIQATLASLCPACGTIRIDALKHAKLHACYVVEQGKPGYGDAWTLRQHPSDCRADISFDDAIFFTSWGAWNAHGAILQLSRLQSIQTLDDLKEASAAADRQVDNKSAWYVVIRY